MNTDRKRRAVYSMVPVQYNSLEELRRDKRRIGSDIHKSFKSMREGVKQTFMPAENSYLNSSNKYLRYIGYGLTMWKTARTVNRFVSYFKKK